MTVRAETAVRTRAVAGHGLHLPFGGLEAPCGSITPTGAAVSIPARAARKGPTGQIRLTAPTTAFRPTGLVRPLCRLVTLVISSVAIATVS